MNRHDQECLQAVFSDGLAEMARGQLAGQQAQAAAVIAYARRMVVDHARSSEEARQIATHLGVSLAQTADATQQQGMADLERVSGGNFDRHYLRHEIEAHEKALARAQQCADGAAGAQIRAFAGQVASLLSDHLDLAKQAELTLPRQGQPYAS